MSSKESASSPEPKMCSADEWQIIDNDSNLLDQQQFYDSLYRDQRTVLTADYAYESCRCPKHQTWDFFNTPKDKQIVKRRLASGTSKHFFAPWRDFAQKINTSAPQRQPVVRPSRFRISTKAVSKSLRYLAFLLLILSRLKPVMSAPFSRDSGDSSTTCSPDAKWKCPCGQESSYGSDYDDLMPFDENFLKQIILAAKIALTKATEFKEEYVMSTFGVDYHRHHSTWEVHHLNWLPNRTEMPKYLGTSLNKSHLDHLEQQHKGTSRNEDIDKLLNGGLEKVYEFLQKIAVGLDQVVKDQFQYNGDYKQQFERSNQELLKVLCEIQIAIEQRKITTKGDVSSAVMNDTVRNIKDASHRNVRDWLIFREYMNVLEYVIAVFEHILTKYKEISKKEDY